MFISLLFSFDANLIVGLKHWTLTSPWQTHIKRIVRGVSLCWWSLWWSLWHSPDRMAEANVLSLLNYNVVFDISRACPPSLRKNRDRRVSESSCWNLKQSSCFFRNETSAMYSLNTALWTTIRERAPPSPMYVSYCFLGGSPRRNICWLQKLQVI